MELTKGMKLQSTLIYLLATVQYAQNIYNKLGALNSIDAVSVNYYAKFSVKGVLKNRLIDND